MLSLITVLLLRLKLNFTKKPTLCMFYCKMFNAQYHIPAFLYCRIRVCVTRIKRTSSSGNRSVDTDVYPSSLAIKMADFMSFFCSHTSNGKTKWTDRRKLIRGCPSVPGSLLPSLVCKWYLNNSIVLNGLYGRILALQLWPV